MEHKQDTKKDITVLRDSPSSSWFFGIKNAVCEDNNTEGKRQPPCKK